MSRWSLTVLMTVLAAALLISGTSVTPTVAGESDVCIDCHGNPDNVHGDLNHTAVPGSGQVTIFADNWHDDAGWRGSRPYFAVTVSCSTCHNNDLPLVHGNDCWTCHPSPYNTLGIWNKGCQQGGCHSFIHEDSTAAHAPFEDIEAYDDCGSCHIQGGDFAVVESNCLNCHATYGSTDVTPPVTTSNAQPVYNGSAKIKFSITDNGKVGVGRTFYRLDGGAVTAGSSLLVADPGAHTLEFWSVDQSGNTELATNQIAFSIVVDNTPPTTTSNAQSAYSQGATITLTATDDSSGGVKTTWYQLNGGAILAGTTVTIPATSGTFTYTLSFWSEDWAGNVEAKKSVTFTVTSGTGTLRLVWGGSDTSGTLCNDDPGANAAWSVRRGGWPGTEVASGSGSCPNWDGVDDVTVTVGTTPYHVIIEWWDSYGSYEDQTVFSNILVTTPGQVVRLSY